MYLNEILLSEKVNEELLDLKPIIGNCSQFLEEASELPLLKNLPIEYNDVHKVKVRQRKQSTTLGETFNQAFKHEHSKIFQRAVFANGELSFIPETNDTHEPFYIFPTNGYKFMYCKEVKNSNAEYKKVFDSLFEQFGNDKDQAITVITDLLKFTYIKTNLHEGISLGSEIIIYNIPYYFGVRASTVKNYNSLLTSLSNNLKIKA